MALLGRKQSAPEPTPEPKVAVELCVQHPLDVEGAAHRAAILERFEEASRARALALELNTRAEQAMVEACNAYDDARKALRRVAEGAI